MRIHPIQFENDFAREKDFLFRRPGFALQRIGQGVYADWAMEPPMKRLFTRDWPFQTLSHSGERS